MEKLLENFRQWAAQESDRRVVDWPLMSSPLPTFAICAAFLITAKLLHIWMKPRKAIDIRWPIWCFDFFHLAISSSLICFLIGLKVFDGANFRWVFGEIFSANQDEENKNFAVATRWTIRHGVTAQWNSSGGIFSTISHSSRKFSFSSWASVTTASPTTFCSTTSPFRWASGGLCAFVRPVTHFSLDLSTAPFTLFHLDISLWLEPFRAWESTSGGGECSSTRCWSSALCSSSFTPFNFFYGTRAATQWFIHSLCSSIRHSSLCWRFRIICWATENEETGENILLGVMIRAILNENGKRALMDSITFEQAVVEVSTETWLMWYLMTSLGRTVSAHVKPWATTFESTLRNKK